MKNSIYSLLISITFFLATKIEAQSSPGFSCNQSTLAVTHLFAPNSISSYSFAFGNADNCLYLCGPNTVVYDTVQTLHCRTTLINSGCHFISSSPTCTKADFVFAKNGSTLTINSNANGNSFRVYYEPLATIIDLTGMAVTYSCTSISFPLVNCSIGIFEKDAFESSFAIFPNPVSNFLQIKSEQLIEQNALIEIINYLGQTVIKTKFKNELDISELPNGIYILQLKNSQGQVAVKRVVVSR